MLLPIVLAAQAAASTALTTPAAERIELRASQSVAAAVPNLRPAIASRATTPPTLDGRDADELWRIAQVIAEFRQWFPVEDGDPRYRTEARVGYDEKYLYVFVRAFDPSPDSIMAFRARRDGVTRSDFIHLMVDSYHDRRTGFRFTANPVGVKRDFYISNDATEDASWDAVWDVATVIDSLGWTAEYRIPFSQLRFPRADSHIFGFAVWRDLARHGERISWPLFRRSRTGYVSQWGEVSGFDGLGSPRRLEIRPYVVSTDASRRNAANTAYERHQTFSFGGDIKYGLTSNLTVDATVNPDFGQVEADPATLNLTAFEQFFQERRPFFLEGAGTFSFEDNLFHSRRIGRSPQLGGVYAGRDNPLSSTILGAAKLTGRTAGGLNVGILDAMTQRETGSQGVTIEPATNYFVARVLQDLRNGNSGVGVMATATHRALDSASRNHLRSSAYALGVDARHRFWSNNYQVSGSVVYSRVDGSEAAILATQRSSVHLYQRPDSDLELDTRATALVGSRVNASAAKTGGGSMRFSSGVTWTNAGYEVNDAGYLARADILQNDNTLGLQLTEPTRAYRMLTVNVNQFNDWSTGGLRLGSGMRISVNAQLANQWNFLGGIDAVNLGASYDDRVARGGPALRKPLRLSGRASIESDPRKPLGFVLQGYLMPEDEGGTRDWGVDPGVRLRMASRFQASLGMHLSNLRNDMQWYGNFDDFDGTSYAFARIDQRTTSLTARFDYTLTTNLSLQLYAQPFVSSGAFSRTRELADPRAARYVDRFAPYTLNTPNDFNVKQFRSNAVLRWEYRPESVIFLVWQQGRFDDTRNPGTFDIGRDYSDLFNARPDNTFLVKGSYRFAM